MKKRLLSLFLAVLTLVSAFSLSACSADKTAPVMTYRSASVSEAMYRYWMSAYKTYFLKALGGTDTEEFLNTPWTIETADGGTTDTTVGQYIEDRILEIVKSNCISLYLFRSYGLSLSRSVKETVKSNVDSEIENAGGRKALNEALAPLGLNIDLLEEMYLTEEKVNTVYNYLYGETMQSSTGNLVLSNGAEPITAEQYDAFYQAHYACVKHVYIRTADKNVLDADGNVRYDADGNVLTAALTDEEKAEKLALCDKVMQEISNGARFDALIELYSEDAGRHTFPDGYIISRSTNLPEEFISNAFDMEIGEIRRVDASYATHIMLRTELPAAGWQDSKYASMLSDFVEYVKSEVYAAKIAPMIEEIEYDTALMEANSVFVVPTTSY